MKLASKIYTTLIFAILYAPIIVLVVFSFNASASTGNFTGFSLKWYRELLASESTMAALRNTLIIAVISSFIATVIGTSGAIGVNMLRNKFVKGAVNSVTNVPMMNPDIVTGVSMMMLFTFVGTTLHLNSNLSFLTVIISHITFNIPYVYLSVMPKIRQMDKHLTEAALDLGCTPFQAFCKVELPSIMPGVVSGAIMAFTLSLDDFVISYFTKGDFETLPTLIYSMTKKHVTPDMYALSTLMFGSVLVLLLLSNFIGSSDERKMKKALAKKSKK
jgi:spermidine/putrescine transport system permease protein